MRLFFARACVMVGFVALGGTFGCADDGTTSGAGGEDGTTTDGSTTATGGASGTGGSGSGGSTGVPCADVITCDAAPPDVGLARPWEHTSSSITASTGFANHRGRDMFYNPGDTLWIMGKFAYGVFDDDIIDEDVDLYLNRSCGAGWEFLTTQRTTNDGDHATVEGVEDSGGWIYYDATSLSLEPGRHRFLMVVGGDLSMTDTYVDIVDPETPVVVTDVDGTLTTSENAEFSALLTGSLPDPNPDSAAVIQALAEKGYRVFYLTARPEWLAGRTRDYLDQRGYPLGIIHTTLTTTGATGAEAQQFKTAELAALAAKGMVPAWAFGNTDSDAGAFETSGVEPPEHRIMFQYTDPTHGCRRIEAYGELLPEIGALGPAVCP